MKALGVLLLSVIVGLVVTLVSGYFVTPFSRMGVDVVFHGMPLPWVIQVIPRAGHVIWMILIADAVFWVLLIAGTSALVLYVLNKIRRQVILQ